MDSILAFFEARSIEVTGHEIRQILLIHASQLNADAMPDLLAMMRRRGYTFVSLQRALEDPAYAHAGNVRRPGRLLLDSPLVDGERNDSQRRARRTRVDSQRGGF